VRADASKTSRIVASIGPGSRVQLGETRDSWRRIRARGIAGWVEPRSSFTVNRTPTKASLAER
jgi:SH3-like domain-containing protein